MPRTGRPRKKDERPHRSATAYYPERIGFAVRAGTREQLERVAERAGVAPADWLRAALRRALDGAERRTAAAQ